MRWQPWSRRRMPCADLDDAPADVPCRRGRRLPDRGAPEPPEIARGGAGWTTRRFIASAWSLPLAVACGRGAPRSTNSRLPVRSSTRSSRTYGASSTRKCPSGPIRRLRICATQSMRPSPKSKRVSLPIFAGKSVQVLGVLEAPLHPCFGVPGTGIGNWICVQARLPSWRILS